ncbi:MAG: hypothetical protein EHM41_05070 [Chloroflexi bacterium]|nr:MAG: hypothetical protein EHM41_05070 [Chloroflexota bacterium]
MKPNQIKYFPIVVLLITLMGVTACTMLQSESIRQGQNQSAAHAVGESSLSDVDKPDAGSQTVLPGGNETTGGYNCTDTEPHPIGQSIAKSYEVDYLQVMNWFCSGYSFENILIALETSSVVNIPTDMLLEMRLDKEWEVIWDETGFTGDR